MSARSNRWHAEHAHRGYQQSWSCSTARSVLSDPLTFVVGARIGTTQSAIARTEGGGTRPSLETLEKLASAVGAELVVGVGEHLSENRSIAKLVREGVLLCVMAPDPKGFRTMCNSVLRPSVETTRMRFSPGLHSITAATG